MGPRECRDRLPAVPLQQEPPISKLVKKAHDGCDHVLDHVPLPDHRCAHERLNVKSVQDGNHRTGLRAVLTCNGRQEHVVELYLWSRRLAPVSAAVMALHRKAFDAVVPPTAWSEVCHLVCRVCTVVKEERYLL